ncbi:hypothetical protein HYFRA_00005082 [Hymenoscyphus fraxineus]|uniref:Uncharacterized protein n=1 Tax=Hymenoscyphus fraxineus TaxID=746836 RepID=A0A9N9LD64_9HELO|nr:hypothetical protein HYFRA_00005082 [Hymenoscyphus fraxineus]
MVNEHKKYNGEVDAPVEAIQTVNPDVIAKLPVNLITLSVTAYGSSNWTRTARISGELNGEPKEYFFKTSYGDQAKPDLVPKPIAWGTYETIPDVHFFVCNFHKITDELPDLETFPGMLAELHSNGTQK